MKQYEQVIKHIKEHGSITSFDAISHYGMTRLAARIYDLRSRGHKIMATPRTKNNKTFAVYSLNT